MPYRLNVEEMLRGMHHDLARMLDERQDPLTILRWLDTKTRRAKAQLATEGVDLEA